MKSVIKGASYILAHVPDMVIHIGTTQTTERIVNPDSAYLKELPEHIRSYADAVAYPPNQVYIGGMTPGELALTPEPWHIVRSESAPRFGKYGEIMPQDEFLLLMCACDVFDLIKLDGDFVADVLPRLAADPVIGDDITARVSGCTASELAVFMAEPGCEPLFHLGSAVGCIRSAHDVDLNLSAHTLFENLAAKASSVLAILHAVKNTGVSKDDVEYVIDCAEEACGDMNQRGGGSLSKSAAEIAGLSNATGCDLRGFCAAPAHALVEAASLVSAGVYSAVAVVAGGCTAKLGMNGKEHIKKGFPILEDVLGGFAVIITRNDGVSPEIDLKCVGRHTVSAGSSPQAVLTALVTQPLERVGMKILDVNMFAPELQNAEITKAAGAGDVPLANYKMIGALAAKRGEMTPKDLPSFVKTHGMTGWAPTQGHIPSGVPAIGFVRDEIIAGRLENLMLIGKGSLFLGRMTNLFDGVSLLIRSNSGEEAAAADEKAIRAMIADAMRKLAGSLTEGDQ